MDPDRTKRRQSIKIIVSEAIMVLAVVVTVIVLAFLVSGYWINSDFKVERQGLLQISSMPTGANVYIDGDSSWLQRTNTSKVLASGEHSIMLTKEGYDSWSKTVNISEGLLYRIHYPRLFLRDGDTKPVLEMEKVVFSIVSPDRSKMLSVVSDSDWQLVRLDGEDIKYTDIDMSSLLGGDEADGLKLTFSEEDIVSANWDHDSDHVLLEIKIQGVRQWFLLDVNNVEKSMNLNKEFGIDFDDIQILDNSSNNLLALTSGNLRKIDVSGHSISATLAEGVISYDHYNNEIVFSAERLSSEMIPEYYIGFLKINDNKISDTMNVHSPAKVVISRFYDEKYVTVVQDGEALLYSREGLVKLDDFELSFIPDSIKVGHDGEFITMSLGGRIATLDMETRAISEWNTGSDAFGWIDDDMIYAILDGELVVYDFDGLNRREIAQGVSVRFPATISTNNKWLYFVSDNVLMRKIIGD